MKLPTKSQTDIRKEREEKAEKMKGYTGIQPIIKR